MRRVKPFLTIDLSKTMFNPIVLPQFTSFVTSFGLVLMRLTFLDPKIVLELFLMRTDDRMYNLC